MVIQVIQNNMDFTTTFDSERALIPASLISSKWLAALALIILIIFPSSFLTGFSYYHITFYYPDII